MKKYYFYTEHKELDPQTPDMAFGPEDDTYTDPVTNAIQDQFRITNLHSSAAPLRAFAITTGTIVGQFEGEDINANTVNLVLKPLSQPDIGYARICYFIYKGILKASLMSGQNNVINNTTEFGQFIIDQQVRRNNALVAAGGSSEGDATYKALGMHLVSTLTGTNESFLNEDPIDHLFFRETADYTPPTIDKPGMYIGDFDNTKFGIEVVLDGVGYDAPLSLCRNLENFIRQDQLGGGSTVTQTILNRIKREEVLRYGDICSFYGSFAKDSKFKAVTVNSGGSNSEENISGDEVYEKILGGTHTQNSTTEDIGTFYNRSRTMLDIRNEYDYSYNLFNHYGDKIKIQFDSAASSEVTYYQSNWPYYFIDNSVLPLNTSNKVKISVCLAKGNNRKPLVFVSQGYIRNFITLKEKKKFVELFNDNDDDYTNPVELVVPNLDFNGNTRVVSSHIKLRYLALLDPAVPTDVGVGTTKLRSADPIDHIFLPVHMDILFQSNSPLKSRVYETERFVDSFELNGRSFTCSTGMSLDACSISFFAFAVDRYKKKFRIGRKNSIVGQTSEAADTFALWLAQNPAYSRVVFSELVVTTSGGTIKKLTTASSGEKLLNAPDTEELILLNIFIPTFQDILNQISASSILTDLPVYFGFKNRNANTAPDGTPFTEYDLYVRGFEIDTGELVVVELNTGKKIYT